MVGPLSAGTWALGLLSSLLAGLAAGLGSLPIFIKQNFSEKTLDGMLGFAAGVMLAATAFSLVLPAVEYGGGGAKGAAIATLGILFGGIFLDLIDRNFPHEHFIKGPEGNKSTNLQQIWLFIIAIAIHNFPEGLAVGVGFGTDDVANGLTLAIGIGLHNMPEGLAVALPLVKEGYSRGKAFAIALLTGLLEPIGAVVGMGVVGLMRWILPFALAFAAGAMLFVISDEIIPETHRNGHERLATYAILVGFVFMMFLDMTLG